MKYYPIFLDLAGKTCLVVGGGQVGTRKALGLAKACARVRVVSPEFSRELCNAPFETIQLMKKNFEPSDLDGVSLVFSATDNQDLNGRVRAAAQGAGILCNIADGRDKGDFILPSVVAQGDLLVAVSTCGASPAMARHLGRELKGRFGPEYETALILMSGIRRKLLAKGHDPEGHKKVFTALVQADLPGLIRAEQLKELDAVLARLLGPEFTFADLVAGQV